MSMWLTTIVRNCVGCNCANDHAKSICRWTTRLERSTSTLYLKD
jgi:hypothetical protein